VSTRTRVCFIVLSCVFKYAIMFGL
jgi:hypothetical protein